MKKTRLRTIALFFILTTTLACAGALAIAEARFAREENRIADQQIKEYLARGNVRFDLYSKIWSDERYKPHRYGHLPNIAVKVEGAISGTIRTNSDGLRETKDYSRLASSVIFLGDSVVEGAHVENDETMDSVFEQLTNTTALNFGVSSRGTLLALEFLKAKYKPDYNTRLVIHGYCLNDLAEAGVIRYFDPRIGNFRLWRYLDEDYDFEKGWLFQVSKYVPFASTAIDFALGSATKRAYTQPAKGLLWEKKATLPWGFADGTALQAQYDEHHLRKMKEFVEQTMKARLVVVLFPAGTQLPVEYKKGERLQDHLITILDKLGIQYIDPIDIFRDEVTRNPKLDFYVYDEVHFGKAGHRLVAQVLASSLGPEGVKPRVEPSTTSTRR